MKAAEPGRPKLLLVEDDKALATLFNLELKRSGYDVDPVRTGGEAMRRVEEEIYDVVITDLKLDGADGLEVLSRSKLAQPETEVIVITGHGTIDTAVAAMKAGAFDYLTKPVEAQELAMALGKALEHRALIGEVRRLREEVKGKYSFEGIIYVSPKMQNILDLVQKVAVTEATVLIAGESGTGKELIARAIHENSPRRDGGFVAINCGALPEGLLESELFGHVKGSFTGADRNKRGLFEEANGGTLFLDEISETTPALQVKLLRALQEGEVRRVGDNHPVKISARLVAATNRDLPRLVAEGKFRDDLYYRLRVFPIQLPALRERPEDIVPLAEHFLRKSRKKLGCRATRFSRPAAETLKAHAWPGNVRELEHAVERALIMSSGQEVKPEDLPPELHGAPPRASAAQSPQSLDEVERRHILRVLESCGRNHMEAAKALGIGRNTLWRKLRTYGIVG